MEVWTDGTLVVQACSETSVVRVLRDGAVIGESKTEHPLSWKTPLAVEVDSDRIWVGNRLQEFRLGDVSSVAIHDDEISRVAALGGGRLAAVLPPVDGVSRLAVGLPGRWEREVALAGLGDAALGLAATNASPSSRAIGGDPTLTVTEHGLVVADGQRGVVAHFTPELELLGLWHSGGASETELTGYATTRGVLVTARWAGRESRIGWLTPDGPRDLRDGYSAFAMPAGDDRFWLVSDFDLELVDNDGNTIAAAPLPHGFVVAAHASGSVCAMVGTTFVHIATAADEITFATVSVGGFADITAIFSSGADRFRVMQFVAAAVSTLSIKHGCAAHYAEDDLHILVPQVRPGAAVDVERALRAGGATHVEIVDPERSPQCCVDQAATM